LATEGIFLDDVLKTYFRREGRRRARDSTFQKTPLSNNSYWLKIAPVPMVSTDTKTPTSVLSTLMAVDYTLEDLTSRVESFVTSPLGQPTNKTELRFTQVLTLLAKPAIWLTPIKRSLPCATRFLTAFQQFATVVDQHNLHRKFLTVVVEFMSRRKHPSLCQQAVDGTIRTALTSYGNKKVLNASNHVLGALQLAHPLLASHHVSMSSLALIRKNAGSRGPLIKIVKRMAR
jgi:hypothetical protein